MASNPLVGMWKLNAVERSTSEAAATTDEPPVGCLVYTEEGWMSESLTYEIPGSGGRTQTVIYCGTYSVEDDNVIHRPKFHSNPTQIGQELPRKFHCDEDNQHFTLIAPNPNGSTQLHWERVDNT